MVVVVVAVAVETDAVCRVVRALVVLTARGAALTVFTEAEAAAVVVRWATPSQPTISAVAAAAATPTVQVARRTSLSAIVRSVVGGCSVISDQETRPASETGVPRLGVG